MIEMATEPCELHDVFVENVIRRRKELGLTQVAMARKLGMTQPSYSSIERKSRVPSLAVVEKVARALDITASELFDHHSVPS